MSDCRWNGTGHPRTLIGRHDAGCTDETCRGCLPCTERHCRVCGIEHIDGTCAGCLAEVRENLDEIRRMCGDLPDEAEVRGVEGEAAMLLGPAADPEAWGHREASARAGRIPADYLEVARDEAHPLWVLASWAMVYRDAFEHDEPSGRVDVWSEGGYLARNLTYMGSFEHVPFEDFVTDLRRCRSHMEAVLHDGEQVEKGAPCPTCRKPLVLTYGRRVVDDRWRCLTRSCDVGEYTTAQYRGWVEDDALHGADRLTAADMERRFRDDEDEPLVKPGEVRVWGSRDLVRKRGRDDHGMTLYDVMDVQIRILARLAAAAECA